jgi:hypothetical protein
MASRRGDICSMGERQVDPVTDSKREDDLESSLVLAVPEVVVVAVLVGDGWDAVVELPGTGLRWISEVDDDLESARDVSLGKKEVNNPKRGRSFSSPIASTFLLSLLCLPMLSSERATRLILCHPRRI